jgi:hypothetical protein
MPCLRISATGNDCQQPMPAEHIAGSGPHAPTVMLSMDGMHSVKSWTNLMSLAPPPLPEHHLPPCNACDCEHCSRYQQQRCAPTYTHGRLAVGPCCTCCSRQTARTAPLLLPEHMPSHTPCTPPAQMRQQQLLPAHRPATARRVTHTLSLDPPALKVFPAQPTMQAVPCASSALHKQHTRSNKPRKNCAPRQQHSHNAANTHTCATAHIRLGSDSQRQPAAHAHSPSRAPAHQTHSTLCHANASHTA